MYWTLGLGPEVLGPWVIQWGVPILVVSFLLVFEVGEALAFLGYWGIVKPFLLTVAVGKKYTRKQPALCYIDCTSGRCIPSDVLVGAVRGSVPAAGSFCPLLAPQV